MEIGLRFSNALLVSSFADFGPKDRASSSSCACSSLGATNPLGRLPSSNGDATVLSVWGRKAAKGRTRLLPPTSVLMEGRDFGSDNCDSFLLLKERLKSNFEQRFYLAGAQPSTGSMPADILHSTDDRVMLQEKDQLWLLVRAEARRDSELEPALASYLYSTILAHRSLERALAFHLGSKLSSATFLSTQLFSLFIDILMEDDKIQDAVRADILAVKDRDPACVSYSHCLLNFKGFLACQAYRVAHSLWCKGRQSLALAIQSRVSEVFHLDIHPAAKIGKGILFDHATGIVIGETAIIGNNVSILHHVTLGGTGAVGGYRHPIIGDGVLIGAGATILGRITVGQGAKIGARSVVLTDVPAHTTAVGNPARLVGGSRKPVELKEVPSETMDQCSFIQHWSDYVI